MNMASKYSKTYSRKKAVTNITQFDKLISEHGKSTHPVAAKTAGHVGKWGVTSFTSLRSINGGYGREDNTKRSYADKTDYATNDINSDISSNIQVQQPKRRKFFKSRDFGSNSEPPGHSPPPAVNITSAKVFSMDPVDKFDNKPVKEANSVKSKPEAKVVGSKSCGGIKLKIFKSRNTDFSANDQYSSTVELPSDDSSVPSSTSSVASSPLMVDVEEAASSIYEQSACSYVDKLPDSPKNTSIDSSFEYNGLIDESSGLPIAKLSNDETLGSEISELESINKTCVPLNRCDTIPLTKLDCDQGFFSSEDGSQNNNVNKCDTNDCMADSVENSTTQEECPTSSNIQLFGTDFDEEEVVDRTEIDYIKLTMGSSTSCTETKNDATEFMKQDDVTSTSSSTHDSSKSIIEVRKPKENISAVKKKSIFKSRSKDDSKKRALYKHKWHGHEEKEESHLAMTMPPCSEPTLNKVNTDPFSFDFTPPLTRVQTWPSAPAQIDNSFEDNDIITRVKCSKEAKKYYTVIKNVKRTHELQESGEFQEYNDEVEYFLDALKNTNSSSTRCLASFNLAQKCLTPAFRMHLRAHGTVTKFFRVLSDAPSSTQLSDCVALVMFILSQDHLNMDLDRDSLELMLNLLDYDATICDSNSHAVEPSIENVNKIKQMCKEMQQKGFAKHLSLDHINAPTLAMETLLSLTSKRAGEWFKEELRELGGIDHLMRTVTKCSLSILPGVSKWEPYYLEKLSKIDRCLKVLENVTLQNVSNQEYLLKSNNSEFGSTLIKFFQFCNKEIQFYPENSDAEYSAVTKALISNQITVMKVLINLTHGSAKEALGSRLLGAHSDIYDLSLRCLLVTPAYLGHDNRFELQVLACCLLLNLAENSTKNRTFLMDYRAPTVDEHSDDLFKKTTECTAMESLVSLFYSSEESAREQEAHTDKIIDNDLDKTTKNDDKKDEEIEETVTRLLQKAGRHMEDTLIAAYTALLSGYCLMDNKEYEERIRNMQPERNFKIMVTVVKKFLNFMNLTATTSLLRSLKPTEKVVKYMEKLDRSPEEEEIERKKKEEEAQAVAYEAFGF